LVVHIVTVIVVVMVAVVVCKEDGVSVVVVVVGAKEAQPAARDREMKNKRDQEKRSREEIKNNPLERCTQQGLRPGYRELENRPPKMRATRKKR